ncbi:MAG: hypothetical protein FWE04_04710 [Oscillospiraceae bacterium]|nr:hypothetical protein [Oscillospiraceae bacterium]
MARKIGFTFIILQIFVVIAVQFALATETVREVFTSIDRMEGTSTAAIIDNIGTVEVELLAERISSNDEIDELNNLRVLVNGRIAGYFDDDRIQLAVRNNALIEIDARDEPNRYRISVYAISDNAMEISRNLTVITDQNIAILGKIHAH